MEQAVPAAVSSPSTLADERAPLLQRENGEQKRTPLPKLQIAIIIFLQISEPLASQSIYPYINHLIRELGITGGDDRKVGYYAGLIESLFFATEAMTVLHWSRFSDRVGRKPVLLLGLLGSMTSMLCFGLSTTFWGLVLSRCLTGLLNGNIGVMKSALGDLTDPTNRAEAFGLLSLVWATGCTLGPFLGGSLFRPHERFPTVFTSPFWKKYPHFLPCLVTAGYLAVAFCATLGLFKETVKNSERQSKRLPDEAVDETAVTQPKEPNASVPLRELLVHPVLLSVSNYACLAGLNICLYALLPLFLTMPVEIGGLGVSPPTIGLTLGIYGFVSGSLQALFFARIVRYLGARRTFVTSMFCFIPAFLLFPIISLIAKHYGINFLVWALIGAMLLLLTIVDMGWGTIFMYVTSSAPNKRSLGATNGLAQMSVSFARAVGPAFSTSLFSFSVQNNILGGYGVYPIVAFFAFLALVLATRLPCDVWPEPEGDEE
ncbi:hypothetical protein CC1G_06167 [Coprinopsis cinerea okayama7|uniref:Major facilitator superfamily (MFS) profile domain-containing protein n=1 Tax=Coprinopsis cinerea (strain Okayama-7 / 130 / ATCC MYA-4618 / FGSC 9003) TaxID=240176 RepID=A8NV20_COPC7|nr:hypothetical protein CC1G_06167 [Coprinopsis cinerea okayama7\|eukprot:XP_001836580.2 hypothetical protein CC1G_06167 [Coprinopsis cinerea okayama7\